jgi:hypothetical protein
VGAIPETVATELAFIFRDHRLIEAVERGLSVGLWALVAYMLIYLRVYGLWFFVIHANDGVWVLLAVS